MGNNLLFRVSELAGGLKVAAVLVAIAGYSAMAETLSVTSANSPYVIDANASYDSVTVSGDGVLIVTNRATLNAGTLYVGNGGKGTMTVTDGSTVAVTTKGGEKEDAPFKIANGANSEGHLYLLDGSKLTAQHGLFSKADGKNFAESYLTISNAQLVINDSVYNTRNVTADGRRTNTVFRLQQGGSFTFGRFVRNSPGTTTLFQFDGGVCTNKNPYMASLDGGWLIFEGVNGHPIDYAVLGGTGNYSTDSGYFVLDGSTASFGTPHVHLTGNGGLRLYSSVNRQTVTIKGSVPVLTAATSDYTGDCVITSKRLSQTAPNQFFSASNRIVLAGVSSATAVLDLNGFNAECAGIVESNCCYVLNPSGKNAATLTLGADNGDSALKTLVCESPVTIRKVGTGRLDLYSDNSGGHAPALTVVKGSVDLYGRDAGGYKNYKWVLTDTYGKNPNQIYVRISELEMFDGAGTEVDFAKLIGGENYKNLTDGNLQSDQFFVKTNFVNNTPYFTLMFSTPTPFASYRLGTGCDYGTETKYGGLTGKTDVVPPAYDVTMCRDPSDWTVYGSMDNYCWVELGKVANYKAPNKRQSWGSTFELDCSAPLTSGELNVYEGATLNVRQAHRMAAEKVLNSGTINYADGAIVELQGAATTHRLLGSGEGSAAVEKTGEGAASVLDDGQPARVKVTAGELRLGANGGVRKRYWRWRVKGMREWWYDPEKWAPAKEFPGGAYTTDVVFARELALYDGDGNRVNGADRASFVAASVTNANNGFQKLLDGDSNTFWGLYFTDKYTEAQSYRPLIPRILRNDESTWQWFVFKFNGEVPAVYSYDIKTMQDHSDRDPACWDFAVSDDGENWTVIEDYTEEDPSDYVYRFKDTANPTARNAYGTYNYGSPLVFVNALTEEDKVCYAADAEVSVGANATLTLPGTLTETGNLRIDATQAADGTIAPLNFAAGGTLWIDNFTRFAGTELSLPLSSSTMLNAANFAGWQLYLNGQPSTKYFLSAADGRLVLKKPGIIMLVY